MKIYLVNPNRSGAITDRLVAVAQRTARPGTQIIGLTAAGGPPTIESHTEAAVGALAVARTVAQVSDAEGFVVACFGDTGVAAAREVANVPVVGMTEAALLTAGLLAPRFAIITMPPRTRQMAEQSLREVGLAHRAVTYAVKVTVADLEQEAAAALPVFLDAAHHAIKADAAEAIVLGCAGLSELVAPLTQATGLPVVDGVPAAVAMAEYLAAAGLKPWANGTYATPGLDLKLVQR